MLKNELEKVLTGSDLTAEEMGAVLEKIASGKVPAVQEPPGCSGGNADSSTTAHGK